MLVPNDLFRPQQDMFLISFHIHLDKSNRFIPQYTVQRPGLNLPVTVRINIGHLALSRNADLFFPVRQSHVIQPDIRIRFQPFLTDLMVPAVRFKSIHLCFTIPAPFQVLQRILSVIAADIHKAPVLPDRKCNPFRRKIDIFHILPVEIVQNQYILPQNTLALQIFHDLIHTVHVGDHHPCSLCILFQKCFQT